MSKLHIIGIDHGNGQIKTKQAVFPSGVICHGETDPGQDNILEFDGQYYSLAVSHDDYLRDKTQNERYYILTLFALAIEMQASPRQTNPVMLAVGLPPGHLNKRTSIKFSDYLKQRNPIVFKYKGIQY